MSYAILITYDATLSHPDDFTISSGWFMASAVWHLDNTRCYPKSSGWLRHMDSAVCPDDLLYHPILCHPDDSAQVLMVSHPDDLCPMPYVTWMTYDTAISHPDDLAVSAGRLIANAVCNPDDIWFSVLSGWLKLVDNAMCHPDDLWYHPIICHPNDLLYTSL